MFLYVPKSIHSEIKVLSQVFKKYINRLNNGSGLFKYAPYCHMREIQRFRLANQFNVVLETSGGKVSFVFERSKHSKRLTTNKDFRIPLTNVKDYNR